MCQLYNIQKSDLTFNNNYCLRIAAQNGHILLLKYLMNFGFTRDEIRCEENYAFRMACSNGFVQIIEYLHKGNKGYELTKKDAQSLHNYALIRACENGHINVVKYIIDEIGLTKKDIMSLYSLPYKMACYNNHYNILDFLHSKFNLRSQDIFNNKKQTFLFLRQLCKYNYLDNIIYLYHCSILQKKNISAYRFLLLEYLLRNEKVELFNLLVDMLKIKLSYKNKSKIYENSNLLIESTI